MQHLAIIMEGLSQEFGLSVLQCNCKHLQSPSGNKKWLCAMDFAKPPEILLV